MSPKSPQSRTVSRRQDSGGGGAMLSSPSTLKSVSRSAIRQELIFGDKPHVGASKLLGSPYLQVPFSMKPGIPTLPPITAQDVIIQNRHDNISPPMFHSKSGAKTNPVYKPLSDLKRNTQLDPLPGEGKKREQGNAKKRRKKKHPAPVVSERNESAENNESVHQSENGDLKLELDLWNKPVHPESGVPSDHISPRNPDEACKVMFRNARLGKIGLVEQEWDAGLFDVDAQDQHGNTVLMVACQNGNKKLAKHCLRRGANINATNNNGETGLHFCFQFGYDSLGEYLIGKGADDTIENTAGKRCREGIARADNAPGTSPSPQPPPP